MCGKLLANEFEKSQKGISVAMVHTGYLRKQNPDGTWETGGNNGKLNMDNLISTLDTPGWSFIANDDNSTQPS